MNRRRLACALAVSLVLAAPAAASAADPPGTKRIVDGVRDDPATASVNVCGGGGTGDIGIRVSAPYRGDDVAPWARISVEFYSDQDGSWHPAAGGDSGWFQAGPLGTGAETGYTFPYQAPAADARLVMRGVAQIEWRPDGASRELVTTPCEIAGQPAGAPGSPDGG